MPARKGQKYKPRTKAATFTEMLTCALCPRTFNRTHSQNKYCNCCRSKARSQQLKRWHKENPQTEYWKEYRKRYYAENTDKIIERTSAYAKTERGKETRKIADQNQKVNNPKKVAARQIVRMALVGGNSNEETM